MNNTRLRFATTVLATAGGALLAVGAFVFAPGTERWIGLGVGAGVGAATVLASATSGRGTVQRALDLILLPICVWALVSARTIELASHGASPGLVKWLSFSAGATIFATGVIGLVAHELGVESDLRWALEQLSGEGSAAAETGTDDATAEPEAEAEAEPEADAEPEAAAELEAEVEPDEPEETREDIGAADASSHNGSNGSTPEFIPTPSGQPSLARRPVWLAPPPADDEDWRPRRKAGA
jgi:hypothetical protein